MKKSVELKQLRTAKENAQQAIITLARTEKRDLTPEEETQFDALGAEADAYTKQIETAEKAEKLDRTIAARSADPVDKDRGNDDDGEGKEKRSMFGQFRMGRAIGMVSRAGDLNGVEKEINDMAVKELRALNIDVPESGLNIPASMMRAAYRADGQTVTQDGGLYGGVLVNETGGEMLQPFLPKLTVEQMGVKVLTGLKGNYPLYSSDQFEFQNLEETEEADPQKVKYYKRIMKPKRSACVALISNQLIIQSSIDVENDIRTKIGTALNRRVFIDLINGSGVGANPLGILNDDIYESTAAQGPLTLAKVLELLGAVEDENSTTEQLAFLTNSRLARTAQGIKLDEGSGVFLADKDGNIYGNKTFRSTQVPTGVGTGSVTTYPLIYGDWDAARVGFWGGMNIMADPYTKAASGELRLIMNVYKDSLASNPKAFAVNKNITL